LRVGIVGAGISGLAAARTLTHGGHEVVVFEKSRGVGGRMATRRLDEFVFDTGATSIAPRGLAIEKVMLQEVDTEDLVQIEKPIYTHVGLRVYPGDAAKARTPRYTYRSGNTKLAKLLAQTLDVRLNTQVDSLEREGARYRVAEEEFDSVILTPPIPQASLLLWSLGESRPFANAYYRSCLSVLLGFAAPTPEVSYHAILDVEQRHPMTWLSLESGKSPCRAPDGHCAIVAQMSPAYSLSHYDRPNEELIGDVLDYVVRLYGEEFRKPVVSDVKRWKYSQPDGAALFDAVNRPGSTLVFAGDGVSAGRVERAFESGVSAANLLMKNP
jgi:renalase